MGNSVRNIYSEIDLSALRRNYITLCSMTKNTVAAVVKNNAYNIGLVPVVEAIQDLCSDFFVATVSEALTIKPYLRGQSVYILSDNIVKYYDEIVANNFIPVLNSLADYRYFHGKCEYVLNIDIGMSRLGVNIDDIHEINNNNCMRYLMGHLSNATTDSRTEYEYNNFMKAVEYIKPSKTSLFASPSFSLSNKYGTDLIRVGGLMYGLMENNIVLENILTIKTKIIQIFNIKQGDCVGYDNTYVAAKPMKIASVCLGYGFGLHTSMSNRGEFVIRKNGTTYKCPILGLLSMDITMIDVSEVHDCSLHDEVIICDKDYSLSEIYKKTQIPQHWLLGCFRFNHINCDLQYIGI